MLNQQLAKNLLSHIFQSSNYIATSSAGTDGNKNPLYKYVPTEYFPGINGSRYLALFTKMPVHGSQIAADGKTVNYVITQGEEPWGTKEVDGETVSVVPGELPTSGYFRTKLDTKPSFTDTTTYRDIKPGSVTKGISGQKVISDPLVGTGEPVQNNNYSTMLKFEDGSTYIYNSDMIFFPESTQYWGKIYGFGIFADNGLNGEPGDNNATLKEHNEQYYKDKLLFWGTLNTIEDPETHEKRNYVEVKKNEIAIFRNNDFQISMNDSGESNVAIPPLEEE